MNQRTKLLVIAMIVVGLGVFGDFAYRRFFEEPAERRERELTRLAADIAAAEDVLLQTADAADELLALEQLSLPYDQELARARYQEWLLSLVEAAKLQSPSVNAGTAVPVAIRDRQSRKPEQIYQRYSFVVRGRGTLPQTTRFLFDFYRGGHLHKIRSLSLTPIPGREELAINMTVEALGMTRCERERELSQCTSQRLAFDTQDAYRSIAHRNFFSRDANAVLQRVMLTAVTFNRTGVPEAWFSFGDGQPVKQLHRGDSLAIPAHDAEVIDIQGEVVLVKINGQVVRLPLGKSIFELIAKNETSL